MRIVRRSLLFVAVLAWSVDATAQLIQLEHQSSDDNLLYSPRREVTGFWERFTTTFDRRASDVFFDRFQSLSIISWNLDASDDAHNRPARAAFHALTKSVRHSLREAVFELPGMDWLSERDDALADFFRGSIGSADEESVAPSDVSYRPSERSWWDALAEKGGLRYGVRPFRSNPYAFVSFKVRHLNETLLLGHMRYHYRNLSEHEFEFALSLPVTTGLSVGLGTSYKICQDEKNEAAVGLTLFKSFRNGGLMHLGAEVRRGPGLFAGVVVPW